MYPVDMLENAHNESTGGKAAGHLVEDITTVLQQVKEWMSDYDCKGDVPIPCAPEEAAPKSIWCLEKVIH